MLCLCDFQLFVALVYRIYIYKFVVRRITCYSYSLFLRLFIIMGVAWLTEPISWAFAPDSNYFMVTDVINQSQGFLIFILFVLKPEVIRRIKQRFDMVANCAAHSYQIFRILLLVLNVFFFHFIELFFRRCQGIFHPSQSNEKCMTNAQSSTRTTSMNWNRWMLNGISIELWCHLFVPFFFSFFLNIKLIIIIIRRTRI